MEVEIIPLNNNVKIPEMVDGDSARMHVYACIKGREEFFENKGSKVKFENNRIILKPGGRVPIPTGLFINLPKGFKINVIPNEKICTDNGVTILSNIVTVGSENKGEVLVTIINHSDSLFTVMHNDKIGVMELQTEHHFIIKTTPLI